MKKVLLSGIFVGLVLIAGWWQFIRSTPEHAFQSMLVSNLSTPSVTRVVEQGNEQLKVIQYVQLQLGPKPVAHALTQFSQKGGLIATEEISNRDGDFVRYQDIVATAKGADGKAIDTSRVVGKWAKLDADSVLGTTVTSGLFDRALMGVLPIANLQPDKRQEMLRFIADNNVFTFDKSKVETITVNGRAAYKYTVSVKPAPYVKLMQEFEKLVGGEQYAGVNANDYASAADITLTIAVDKRSQVLAQVQQPGGGRTETYQGFGIVGRTELPKATLTTKQLTKLLGELR